MLLATASQDGRAIQIVIEQEPGASGKSQIDYLVRQLIGYRASGMRATGDKATRAGPLSGYAASGNVKLVRGAWNSAFLDELEAFDGSGKGHDDQVDAASGAFESLAQRNVVRVEHLRM
jgi:predicted phage terminase large subunit-like protein